MQCDMAQKGLFVLVDCRDAVLQYCWAIVQWQFCQPQTLTSWMR